MLSTKCAGCAIRWIFENFLSLIIEHLRARVINRIFRHQSVSNHRSCKRFVTFLASEILKQKAIGLLGVWGRVGVNESPYLAMHTVEPISYPEPTFLLVSTEKRQAVNSREICQRMRLGGRKGVTYTKINKDGGNFFRMLFAFSLACNALCLFNPYWAKA